MGILNERGPPVTLSTWLQELNKANTEEEVVAFANGQLEHIRAGSGHAAALDGHAILDADDIREIASQLAQMPFTYNAPGSERHIDQQVLILFSLATDRLSQLETRGFLRRTPERFIPLR
jgi:predicted glycoside hydrolase/deacetylase ChbG (UPF0249 family)